MNYEARATVDDHTCPSCSARHGQIMDHPPASYICTNIEDGCRCVGIATEELTLRQKHPQHGGKREGAGRKPTATGTTQPIYMGPLEDDLRAQVLALPPQARKFALACLVKLAMAKTQGEFIVAFRDVLRGWGSLQALSTDAPEPLENSLNSNASSNNG